jgi:hypothetical protein
VFLFATGEAGPRSGTRPLCARIIQAALLAAILWVVDVCTSKVRISGSASRRCRTASGSSGTVRGDIRRNVVQLAIQAVLRCGGAKCRAKGCFEKR